MAKEKLLKEKLEQEYGASCRMDDDGGSMMIMKRMVSVGA